VTRVCHGGLRLDRGMDKLSTPCGIIESWSLPSATSFAGSGLTLPGSSRVQTQLSIFTL
jgi:hypothetical protein